MKEDKMKVAEIKARLWGSRGTVDVGFKLESSVGHDVEVRLSGSRGGWSVTSVEVLSGRVTPVLVARAVETAPEVADRVVDGLEEVFE